MLSSSLSLSQFAVVTPSGYNYGEKDLRSTVLLQFKGKKIIRMYNIGTMHTGIYGGIYFFLNYAALADKDGIVILDSVTSRELQRYKGFYYPLLTVNNKLYTIKDDSLYEISPNKKNPTFIDKNKAFDGTLDSRDISKRYMIRNFYAIRNYFVIERTSESDKQEISVYDLNTKKLLWQKDTQNGLPGHNFIHLINNSIILDLYEVELPISIDIMTGKINKLQLRHAKEIKKAVDMRINSLGGQEENASMKSTPCQSDSINGITICRKNSNSTIYYNTNGRENQYIIVYGEKHE